MRFHNKVRLGLVLLSVLAATSVFAVDPIVPPGYIPWFSVEITEPTPDTISMSGAAAIFPAWDAITVVVAASGLVAASVPSDPSAEYLILPEATVTPPATWLGPSIQKAANWNVRFTKSTGGVTRYTVFQKTRTVYSGCSKPGTPALSK